MFHFDPSRFRTLSCAELAEAEIQNHACVAGLVVTRQRPGTASGVIFITLEDESGIANVIVWPKIYERFRRAVISGRLLRVTGQLQRENSIHHLIAREIEDLSHLLDRLSQPELSEDIDLPEQRSRNPARGNHPREQARNLFPSRDFH